MPQPVDVLLYGQIVEQVIALENHADVLFGNLARCLRFISWTA